MHWVSPTGTATWVNAESGTPLSGTACCSLGTANSNAGAGDTITLRGGTYNIDTAAIQPANSGTLANRITYQVYTGETATFTRTLDYYWAINIDGKSYIIVDGITGSSQLRRWMYLNNGASYNEIKNCTFINSSQYDCGWRIGLTTGAACRHNWIHDNTFAQNGYVSTDGQDMLSLWQLGYGNTTSNESDYNTIEDNLLYYGGHECGETFTCYNVFKNNFFHNEGWMTSAGSPTYPVDENGKYGNRNFQVYDGQGRSGTFNLVEGNRFQASGQSPDDDGGDGFTLTAPKNIVRFNEIINGQNNGLLLKIGTSSRSDNNRIYNNTIVWNGRYSPPGAPQWQGYGIRYYSSQTPAVGNVIINNIVYGNTSGDIVHRVYGAYNTETDNTFSDNWLNADGDPLFQNDTHSDLTSQDAPDLTLNANSGCIEAGTNLTLANGAGTNSTTLVVDDALFFQDGTWGSDLARGVTFFPDQIAIGTVGNTVAISSINYSTNTITLAAQKTWSDNAPVWLYKDSSGNVVLNGTAPNYGAYQGEGSQVSNSESITCADSVAGAWISPPSFGSPSKFTRANY